MTQPYPAELYAALHLGNSGDLDFYREQCHRAHDILELGCGYGRVLEALVEDGRQLTGLDVNRELLALARFRLQGSPVGHFQLVAGDMRRFAFARTFDRILIPYSGIYCLLQTQDVLECFRCVAAHLEPDGRFLFDAYSADAFHDAPNPEEAERDDLPEEVATLTHAGITYHVTEQSQWWRAEQRMQVVYVHEPRDGGHSIATPLQHHYLLSHQIEPLLNQAGLELVSLDGDYHGTPFNRDADLVTVVARHA